MTPERAIEVGKIVSAALKQSWDELMDEKNDNPRNPLRIMKYNGVSKKEVEEWLLENERYRKALGPYLKK